MSTSRVVRAPRGRRGTREARMLGQRCGAGDGGRQMKRHLGAEEGGCNKQANGNTGGGGLGGVESEGADAGGSEGRRR